jgi:hypothetical protein
VTHEHCDACGFDGASYDDESLLDCLRDQGERWRGLLQAAGPQLRVRPEPEVWSCIEYAAHTRDILALHVYGVEQAITVDEPVYPAISGDLVDSAAANYADSVPEEVAIELAAQSSRLADVAEQAGPPAWSRGLTIGTSRSDVRQMLEHALHDSLHHLDDVERGLVSIRA